MRYRKWLAVLFPIRGDLRVWNIQLAYKLNIYAHDEDTEVRKEKKGLVELESS